MTTLSDAGITATVTAEVTEGESAMSESDFASEGAPVAPEAEAVPADAADPAAPAADEDVAASEADADEAEVEEEAAPSGELLGDGDAGQAVHFTETEGLGFGPGIDAEEEGEEEV